MSRCLWICSFFLFGCITRQPASPVTPSPLQRQYTENETLTYRIQMTHSLDGVVTSTYDAVALGTVKKDGDQFYEEFEWTSIVDEDKAAKFSSYDKKFRQTVSLASGFKLTVPRELPKLSSFMIGPVTDLLTFYVDEALAIRQPGLQRSGDRVYLNTAVASSWGSGEDCLDFDILLNLLDSNKGSGEIRVKHLPPAKMCIHPPAAWMNEQVKDTPNNWYDVKPEGGHWTASVGKETFEVDQRADLSTGIILGATMNNPVVFRSRVCEDRKLKKCSEPSEHKIVRTLTLSLEGR